MSTSSNANASTNPSISIRVSNALYDQAKLDAVVDHRTIAGQIEYWARIGRAALDNPDLPVTFVAESLAALAEPKSQAVRVATKGARK
jgi:hypothetical protein